MKKVALGDIDILEKRETSREKIRFLELCAKRVHEAVGVWVELVPEFDIKLYREQEDPHRLVISASKYYDAELHAGGWSYIDFVSQREKTRTKVLCMRADKEVFIFEYGGETFVIHYGKRPKARKK